MDGPSITRLMRHKLISNHPNMHAFGVLEETLKNKGNMCDLHTDGKPLSGSQQLKPLHFMVYELHCKRKKHVLFSLVFLWQQLRANNGSVRELGRD